MLKISDAIEQIVAENSFLEFGFSQNIFNLTQLARFMKPLIEARVQKEVQVPAIVMNLSRSQRGKQQARKKLADFQVKNIDVYSNLGTMTLFKRNDIHDRVNLLFERVHEQKGYFAITESSQEVTIFFPRNFLEVVLSTIEADDIKYSNTEITCIRVRFDEEHFETPGLLFFLMQKIYLQGINVVEISSTYTEFCFYLKQDDVKLAFETLHDGFL